MKEASSKRISPIYIFGLINFQKPLVELTPLYEDEFSFTFIYIHVCHERLCNRPRFDRGLRKLRIGLFLGEIFLGFLNFLSIIVPQSDGNLAPIIDRSFQSFSVSTAQKHCYIDSILINIIQHLSNVTLLYLAFLVHLEVWVQKHGRESVISQRIADVRRLKNKAKRQVNKSE